MVPSIIDVWGFDRELVHLLLQDERLKNEMMYGHERSVSIRNVKRLWVLFCFKNVVYCKQQQNCTDQCRPLGLR